MGRSQSATCSRTKPASDRCKTWSAPFFASTHLTRAICAMRLRRTGAANRTGRAAAAAVEFPEVNGWRKALRVWPWLAAILSGLLCIGSFPPFNQAWLCWFALTPLIAAIWFSGENSRKRWLRDLLLGYVTGLVFFAKV